MTAALLPPPGTSLRRSRPHPADAKAIKSTSSPPVDPKAIKSTSRPGVVGR